MAPVFICPTRILMKSFLYLLSIISIPFVLSACMLTGHYTAYIKDNIKAVGTRGALISGKAIYSTISIGTPSEPFDVSKNKFSIKLSDSDIISTEEMTFRKISELPGIKKSVAIKGRLKEWEGKADVVYFIYGYFFVFNGEELVLFEADEFRQKELIPVIGNFNKTEFYKFPITEKQLEKLFGKPNIYENRYSL